MENYNRTFTIWEFHGVTIKQDPVIEARVMIPGELHHEYQRILGRVEARTASEAISKFIRK